MSIVCGSYCYTIQYSPEIAEILKSLSATTDKIPACYENLDITKKADRKVVHKYLIQMSLSDMAIGSFIALDQENREINNRCELLLLMRLLNDIKCFYTASYKHFGKSYEDSHRIEVLFNNEMKLQRQSFHQSYQAP
jgi:hypothetical protein